ncbi:MAG TPA: hypothetical protein VFC78_21450 [Tepidisphaeraceae bacterium]|nr:hypothetical protein [Tepidisphaeraceae bacterium]
MNAPMFGNWTVRIEQVRPFTIHGDQYFELHVTKPDEPGGGTMSLKVPLHAMKGQSLKAGDRVIVSFLAGQVTSAMPIA